MKLAMLLPTNKPKVFMEVFLPSVHNLVSAKDDIMFSINFQPPWTDNEISEVVTCLRSMGIRVVYRCNEYYSNGKGDILFNKIRYDCAVNIGEDVKYYGLCDDDFCFENEAGQMILNIIDCFEDDPNLGVIQCKRTHYVIPLVIREVNPAKHEYFTDNGFFFRRLDSHLIFPESALQNVGAGEEFVIGLAITSQGYKAKLRTKSKINHKFSYGNLSNKEWGTEEVTCSRLGNRTYIINNYSSFINNYEENII